MKKVVRIFLGSILIAAYAPCISAQETPPPRVKGKIEYSFESEKEKRNDQTFKSDAFIQRYEMELDGSVYSRNLMTYDVFVGYDIKDTTNNENTVDTKGLQYRVSSAFLQKTKYPFRIFLSDYTTSNTVDSVETKDTIRDYGISGSVDIKPLPITYGIIKSDTITEGDLDSSERSLTSYMLSTSKQIKNTAVRLSHVYRDSSEHRSVPLAGSVATSSDITNTTTVDVRSKFSSALKFDATLDYRDYRDQLDSNGSVIDITTLSNLSWRPNRDYTASLDIFASDVQEEENRAQFTSIYANSNYRITKELSTFQSISMYAASNSAGSNSASNTLSLGVAHNTMVQAGEYDIRLNNTLSGSNADTTVDDERSTANGWNYQGDAATSKYLETLDAQLSLAGNCYARSRTNEETEAAVTAQESLNKTQRIYPSLLWSNSASFSQSYIKQSANDSSMALSSSMRYEHSIGMRGNIRTNARVKYGKSRTRRSFVADADALLRYNIIRSMVSITDARIMKDFELDTMTYSAGTTINYRLRQLLFSGSLRHTVYEAALDRSQTKIYFKVARIF